MVALLVCAASWAVSACGSSTEVTAGQIDGCFVEEVTVIGLEPELSVVDLSWDPVEESVWIIARNALETELFKVASDGGLERSRDVSGFRPRFVTGDRLLVSEDATLRSVDGGLVFDIDLSTADSHNVRFCWSDELQLALSPSSGVITLFEPGSPPRELTGNFMGFSCTGGGMVALAAGAERTIEIVAANDAATRTEFRGVSAIRGAVHIASQMRVTVVRSQEPEARLRVEHHVVDGEPLSVDLGVGVYFMSSQGLLPGGRGAVVVSYGTASGTLASKLMVFDPDEGSFVVADEWELESTGITSSGGQPLLSKVLGTDDGYVLVRHLHRELEVSRWSCRE